MKYQIKWYHVHDTELNEAILMNLVEYDNGGRQRARFLSDKELSRTWVMVEVVLQQLRCD